MNNRNRQPVMVEILVNNRILQPVMTEILPSVISSLIILYSIIRRRETDTGMFRKHIARHYVISNIHFIRNYHTTSFIKTYLGLDIKTISRKFVFLTRNHAVTHEQRWSPCREKA